MRRYDIAMLLSNLATLSSSLFPMLAPSPASPATPLTIPNRLSALAWVFIRPRWKGAVLLALFPMLNRAAFASGGYATKKIMDAVLATKDGAATEVWQAASGPLLFFFAMIASVFFLHICQWVASYRTRLPMLAEMRQAVFAYVQRHPASYFDNNLSGKVAHKAVILPEQTMWLLERVWFDLAPSTGFFLAVAGYFFSANPIFAGIALGWLTIYFAICLRLGRACAAYAARHNDAKTQVTGKIIDVIVNIKNVIFFASHRQEDSRIEETITNTLVAQQKQFMSTVRMRSVQHVLNILMWVMLFTGAIYAWTEHRITAGDFVMISTLGSLLITRAQELGDHIHEYFDVYGSARESLETLVVPRDLEDIPDAQPLQVTCGEIRFERLGFAYEGNKTVFSGLDLVIPAGQRVGLIGPSGAGKTTLTTLLLRLHDPQQGRILIDGQDIAKVTQESLHLAIGLIPQDTILFHRTLTENIRHGRADASDAEVREAARHAHAADFIEALPKGYDTLVGERGVKLSGGQRQRIAIARALLKDAPILLLDEATSALDSESEAAIQTAMHAAMQGRTVIAIAHRLSTIAHLDRLIVMKDGKIAEDGTHAELLAQGGVYAQLWQKQSGGFLVMKAPQSPLHEDPTEDLPSTPLHRIQDSEESVAEKQL